MKLYSEACERNKEPIFKELLRLFSIRKGTDNAGALSPVKLLEVGSGTGQHAAYFSEQFTKASIQVSWQPTDLEENIEGINNWIAAGDSAQILPPKILDLACAQWSRGCVDYIFTANTLHIVSWELGKNLIEGASICLESKGLLIIYGPFNYQGDYTSTSNKNFDAWLKGRDVNSGIRNFESLVEFASNLEQPLALYEDNPMPANNRLLVFIKH